MTSDEAIAFLKNHQPMPSDSDITDAEGQTYARILKHFEANPDVRCIPLLIDSVSSDTGLGMYEHIGFVLMAHPREQVITCLRVGLLNGTAGVKWRCCGWAADLAAWELEPLIGPLLRHEDEDIRAAAAMFLQAREG